jgi:hypothetical protein
MRMLWSIFDNGRERIMRRTPGSMHSNSTFGTVKRTDWNPEEFAYHYERQDYRKQAVIWKSLKPDQRKLYQEWEIFRRFGSAEGSPAIDLNSIVTIDPISVIPPAPDIACRVAGQVEYFELGEIIDEELARAAGKALKTNASSFGGGVSLWPAVESILNKKCGKSYCPFAKPLSLLLYYGVGRQASFWPYLRPLIRQQADGIVDLLRESDFEALWIYEPQPNAVLLYVSHRGVELLKAD